MFLKLSLVLLVVFFTLPKVSFGQEIIFTSKNLKNNANNIFPKKHSLSQSKSKVYNLGDNLIIDYIQKHYIYSFLFDENMKLIEEQNWKIEDSTYSFFESFGEISNRIYVFKGFLNTKLYLFSQKDKKEITINIRKNKYLGSFSTQTKFYLLGYNKKDESISITSVDKNLKTYESSISLSTIGGEKSEKTTKILDKVFSISRFDEVSQFQLNTTKEIIHKNKYYPREDGLYFSINPESNNTELKSYLIHIDLETFESSLLATDLVPLKGTINSKNLETNSILQGDEYFIVHGDKTSFSFLAINKNTGESLYRNEFDAHSFLNLDYEHRFDFELSGMFVNKTNNHKSINRSLKTIFARSIGIKVKLVDGFYYLTIETIAGSSNNPSVTYPSVITTKNYPGMIDTGYNESAKISMNLIFNENSSNLENFQLKEPFQKIDNFMKESFYYSFKLLGTRSANQKKRIPSGELRFKFKSSYYLAYYNHQDEQFKIRKFN